MKLKLTVALAMGVATTMSMAQEVVKIGHVAPLSGAIAHLGKDNEYGARLAIEELNAKGVSIGGKKSSLSCWLKTMPLIPSKALLLHKNWWTPKSMAS